MRRLGPALICLRLDALDRLVHQGPQGVFHNVLDDVLRGIVGAAGLALAPVGLQVNLPGVSPFNHCGHFGPDLRGLRRPRRSFDFIGFDPALASAVADRGHRLVGVTRPTFEQSFIDGPQVAHVERAVIHKLAAGRGVAPAEQVNRLDQCPVADGLLLQEGVQLRVKEPAVVTRHTQEAVQFWVAAVDDVEQVPQPTPINGGRRRWRYLEGCNVFFDPRQAIASAVWIVMEGQQAAAFAVEDEQQAIEQVEAIVIDLA